MTRSKKYRNIRISISFSFLFLGFLGATMLPFTAISEYSFAEFIDFYIPFYPHLTYYPLIFFWCSTLCLALAWRYVPLSKARIKRIVQATLVALVLSLILTYVEQSGPRMMVLEFNEKTQKKYCMKEIIRLDPQIKCSEYNAIGTIFKKNNDYLFNYNFWKEKSRWNSHTRFAYLFSVFAILFGLISSYSSHLFTPPRFTKLKEKFLTASILSVFFLIFWIPIRTYYNAKVKFNVFNDHGLIISSGSGNFGFYMSGTEVIIMFLLIIYIIMLIVEIFNFNQNAVGIAITVLPIVGAIFFVRYPDLAAAIFGFGEKSEPRLWFFWLAFATFLIWYIIIRQNSRSR